MTTLPLGHEFVGGGGSWGFKCTVGACDQREPAHYPHEFEACCHPSCYVDDEPAPCNACNRPESDPIHVEGEGE